MEVVLAAIKLRPEHVERREEREGLRKAWRATGNMLKRVLSAVTLKLLLLSLFFLRTTRIQHLLQRYDRLWWLCWVRSRRQVRRRFQLRGACVRKHFK